MSVPGSVPATHVQYSVVAACLRAGLVRSVPCRASVGGSPAPEVSRLSTDAGRAGFGPQQTSKLIQSPGLMSRSLLPCVLSHR